MENLAFIVKYFVIFMRFIILVDSWPVCPIWYPFGTPPRGRLLAGGWVSSRGAPQLAVGLFNTPAMFEIDNYMIRR
jgi:hypothetical protein